MFNNLTSTGLEDKKDVLGGGNKAIESDIYTGVVKAFYAGKSNGGAASMTLVFSLQDGSEYKETMYITDKEGKNYFLNKNDKSKKIALPGFTIADEICLMTTEKPISEQEWEEKVVNEYDFDAKKELPKSVMMPIDVLGKEVTLAIIKTLEDKKEKSGNEYVPTGETVERNNIEKVFHTDSMRTMVEVLESTEAVFHEKWLEKNKGTIRDKTESNKKSGAKSGSPVASKSSEPTTERKSLFGKK